MPTKVDRLAMSSLREARDQVSTVGAKKGGERRSKEEALEEGEQDGLTGTPWTTSPAA
jgi:hypothetical protein